MMQQQITDETLAHIRETLAKAGLTEDLMKATFAAPTSTTTGLNYYDLEQYAKRLWPKQTPLRNEIPRMQGPGGTAANWRAVTAIDTSDMPLGVADGVRAGEVAHTVKEFTAKYVELGQESSTTFAAELAARGFDDVRAIQAVTLLDSVQIQEERLIIGGNSDVALGVTPTPTLTPAITGGSLTNAASPYHVRVVALTLAAFRRGSLALGIPTTRAVVSADGGTTTTVNGGAAIVSVDATATIASGVAGSIACSVAAVPGAVAYAWFIGTAAGSEVLNKITTVNTVTLTATTSTVTPGTGFADVVGTAFAADHSTNSLVFNGLISLMASTNSNSYFHSMDGVALTADGAGGIVEIDAMLKSMWDNYLLGPDTIWLSSQEMANFVKKVTNNNTTGLNRTIYIDSNAMAQGSVIAGVRVTSYLNKFAMDAAQDITVRLHPYLPAGTLIATSRKLPYANSNVPSVMEMETRREYYQIEWPLVTRKYQTGVYVDEVLKCYFLPALGTIVNIPNS